MMPRSAASTRYRPVNAQIVAEREHDRADAEAASGRAAAGAASAGAAAEQRAQTALQVADHLVEIGGPCSGLLLPQGLRLPGLPPGSFQAMSGRCS
jgi:hypothetical protein